MRRTVPPSAEIEAQIDQLLAVGVAVDPHGALSKLAKLGARLIIQRAVEDEFDAWLGRARYERRAEAPMGSRNGFRARTVQTAEGELSVEIPQVREAAAPFVSRLFPRATKLLRTEPLKALVIGAFVRGLSSTPRWPRPKQTPPPPRRGNPGDQQRSRRRTRSSRREAASSHQRSVGAVASAVRRGPMAMRLEAKVVVAAVASRRMDDPQPEQLARAFMGLFEWAQSFDAGLGADGGLGDRLREHMGGETEGMPVISRPIAGYQRVNFQVAIDAYLEAEERGAELIGLPMMEGYRVGLAELVKRGRGAQWFEAGGPGPIEYEPVQVGERRIMCVAAGLWLIHDDPEPLLLMLKREDRGPGMAELGLEIMARERALGERMLGELERLMAERNAYRGRILVLSGSPFGGVGVEVQRLPAVTRAQIVFPAGILERIERHTKTFSEHVDALRAAGRHLKRGLLLHGPPGTGKTLTVMYLAELMPDRTVLLLTGQSLGAITPACEMARELAPAMLVLEDVDLVAENRMYGHETSLLFELLNQMDGLNEDTDIIFVLTTNRPEVIEPALASRPGRIDLAVNLPLPGAEGRSRLLDLYSAGLQLDVHDRTQFITVTEGTTPAFIREVLRRAALFAAERGDPTRVNDELLSAALQELSDSRDQLGSSLLGGPPSPAPKQ